MRRFGDPIQTDRSYRHRPGAYAILPYGNQVLLTYQSAPEPEFQLPGGGIDPGETGLTALHREVIEETGFRIARPRRLGFFRRFTFMPEYDYWAEKVCHVYVARPVYELHAPTEPDHQAVWVKFDDALDLLANDGDRSFFARYLRGL